jgi:hypothetical protein
MTQSECLTKFKIDYPMVTMGDLQSFVLGMQARESVILEYRKLIKEIQISLSDNIEGNSMVSWIDEQLKNIQ